MYIQDLINCVNDKTRREISGFILLIWSLGGSNNLRNVKMKIQ